MKNCENKYCYKFNKKSKCNCDLNMTDSYFITFKSCRKRNLYNKEILHKKGSNT